MINRIILFSIQNKIAVGLFTFVLILYGTYSLTQLPIDAVPDITNNQVQVSTVAPTLAAQEVERFITAPVEVSVSAIPDVIELRSISRFGLSVITIVFKDNVDIYKARQMVTERLKEAESQIPEGMGKPELAPVTTGLGEIYQYTIHAKPGYEGKYSATELRTIQDWIVRRQLLGTPGVAEVSSFGGFVKQYEVAVNPDKLRSLNITIPEIFDALKNNNENTGGAYIDKQPNVYFIRGVGLVNSLDDVRQIPVKTLSNGTPVLIRDIATVQFGSALRYGAMTYNDNGEVVGAIVMMLKGANSAEVIGDVKKRVAIIRKSLPEGVVIDAFIDRTKLVDNAIGTVEKNLIEGALIVIFVLVLFLGNLRAGFITASIIPLAMLFAVIMMNLFGVSGNLMSLGAIDFGLIVDGAVIIVEAALHRIMQNNQIDKLTQHQMDDEVYQSASRMMNSSTFGQIIILIVYIPILSLIGIEGKMFRPMAMTVSFAIIGALILSLTYVPMMSALLLPKKNTHKKNISDRMMDFFQRGYKPIIEFAIRRKVAVIAIALILLAGSIGLFTTMGGEFIPTLEEGDFAVETRLPQGSSLSQTVDVMNHSAKIIKAQFPEVIEVVGKIGSSEVPTDPMPIESGDMMIILKDKDQWTSATNREELANKMAEALSAIPGVSFDFQQPIAMRFNELMTGVRQDVAIKIFGENLDTLSYYAEKVAAVTRTVEGTTPPYVETVTGLPQITVRYNRSRMAQYGLNISDINRIIKTAFAGEASGVVFEDEKRFDLVVRLQADQRKDIENVRNLFVPLPSGGQIPLQQVAVVDYEVGPTQISREDAKRRIVVGLNVNGRDVKSVVEEIQVKLDKKIKLPPGYYYTYGGTFENLVAASERLSIAVPVALLLIFVLLYFTFGSAKQAALIYSAIPMSAIGGIAALWLRGMPFSISAGVGFIALFGVAVLNGIVLISTFSQLEAEGVEDIKERVIRGTRIRLRPVLMTASVASLGFLPMAISSSSGAEVQRPLATVVIGGLITATALTLIVLPALYILFTQRRKMKPGKTITSAIVLFLFLTISTTANAQTADTLKPVRMSLDSVVSIALRNNPAIQSSQLQIEQQQKLKKSAWDFGKTGLFYENEDLIKGSSSDGILKIGISQTLDFPTVYTSQHKVAEQNVLLSETSLSVNQKNMVREIRSAYYNLWFAVEKQKLLRQQDSIYADFEKAATLRFSTGESSYLEKLSAQAKHKEIQIAQEAADTDVAIAQEELKKLLNMQQPILPVAEPMQKLKLSIGNVLPSSHPVLSFYQQKVTLADYQRKVEINRMLPGFSFRYFNQNIFGISPGYYGYSFGVSIPLFFWTQQGRIQGAKIQQQIAQKDFEATSLQLNTGYNQAVLEVRKNQRSLQYYENTGLNQADEILKAATTAFKNGEIGYVEYTALLSQSIEIKNSYINSLNNYNQSVIRLNYFLNQ
ncbi:MAG: CusA/CzcA family heavy metal efflux RND transporter [Bacteroidia bacterium]